MRKFTDFERKALKAYNRSFHGKLTDYTYKFRYIHYAKWRNSTPIEGEITAAGKDTLKITLVADCPKITGRKFGKPSEHVIFSRTIKYWDCHPNMKAVRDNPEDNELWKWCKTHKTLGEWLSSLDSMLYGLCYGLGELNYSAGRTINNE